jgi:hypothetical protein
MADAKLLVSVPQLQLSALPAAGFRVGTLGSTRMSSEVMACSAPSMGALNARPPTAIRMFFACKCRG